MGTLVTVDINSEIDDDYELHIDTSITEDNIDEEQFEKNANKTEAQICENAVGETPMLSDSINGTLLPDYDGAALNKSGDEDAKSPLQNDEIKEHKLSENDGDGGNIDETQKYNDDGMNIKLAPIDMIDETRKCNENGEENNGEQINK